MIAWQVSFVGEQELIASAQRGDAAALALLLQQHYLAVKKYLITVTFDRALAEDLTQETMIRAIQRIGQYAGKAQFSTWLISIATNLYTDTLRRYQRERRLLERYDHPSAVTEDEPAFFDLMERLRALPRDVALPIIMRHYYGYSYEQIAAWMKIPVGTAKSRIHNGIRAVRKEAEADGP